MPVDDVEDFLAFLAARGASPNTLQGYAYDLRDFFVWLEQTGLDFRRVRLEVLAQLRIPSAVGDHFQGDL